MITRQPPKILSNNTLNRLSSQKISYEDSTQFKPIRGSDSNVGLKQLQKLKG